MDLNLYLSSSQDKYLDHMEGTHALSATSMVTSSTGYRLSYTIGITCTGHSLTDTIGLYLHQWLVDEVHVDEPCHSSKDKYEAVCPQRKDRTMMVMTSRRLSGLMAMNI
jgi:hypothetical protein